MKVEIYIDGAARGNPGPAGIGVVIMNEEKVLLEVADYIGETTNNQAEYLALIRGLEEAIDLDEDEVEVFSDSELLVRQMTGEYRVKNHGLTPLHHHAKTLSKKFQAFSISHVARYLNKQADRLANQGIDNEKKAGRP